MLDTANTMNSGSPNLHHGLHTTSDSLDLFEAGYLPTTLTDDEEGDLDDFNEDLQEQCSQMKEEVAMLKKADAPLSLLFAAFEKQMACDVSDEAVDSENESEVSAARSASTSPAKNVEDEDQTVSQLFANFNGFSSDEED